MINTATLTYQR